MTKVLIANRGEIAVRIIRTLKELSIKSIAVYSEGDRSSLHVSLADEAYCIGPSRSADSYLNIDNVITAAKISGADAIHPGYGFLSEVPEFAKRCEEEGLIFIGPSAETMSTMGDKAQARATVEELGLPVVPGSDGLVDSLDEAKELAEVIGFPLLFKAVAGGGGKGMRLVYNADQLPSLYKAAKKEAKGAFDDDRLYMEKYIDFARHIEVQLLGDGKGNAIHLFERDCSIQRNNQKLIEEAPAEVLNEETRTYITELSAKVIRDLNYAGAATIEFLYVEEEKQFYFMEMNTRIQVEHPITEAITGIDIIEQQIEVACNHGLTITQNDVQRDGFALEVRVNAENPTHNFLPSPGPINQLHFALGRAVRIDSHLYTGYTIPPYYDSMIGKIIVHATNRNRAIKRMQRVLDEIVIGPIDTTLDFQRFIMGHPKYEANNVDIKFLERNKIIESE